MRDLIYFLRRTRHFHIISKDGVGRLLLDRLSRMAGPGISGAPANWKHDPSERRHGPLGRIGRRSTHCGRYADPSLIARWRNSNVVLIHAGWRVGSLWLARLPKLWFNNIDRPRKAISSRKKSVPMKPTFYSKTQILIHKQFYVHIKISFVRNLINQIMFCIIAIFLFSYLISHFLSRQRKLNWYDRNIKLTSRFFSKISSTLLSLLLKTFF